jgi:hypothetical protein
MLVRQSVNEFKYFIENFKAYKITVNAGPKCGLTAAFDTKKSIPPYFETV